MNILAIETTGKYGSASVITGEGRVFSASSEQEMNHLKDIIFMCDEAIRLAGISKSDLTHVAASVGPGSFTGIRIGVVTARTFAQALGIPCVAVSSLKAMAVRAADYAYANVNVKGLKLIVPIINARRHQTYAGVWHVTSPIESDDFPDADSIIISPAYEERQYMIEELLSLINEKELINGKALFIGDGIDAYEDIIKDVLPAESFILAPPSVRYQHSESVARIAYVKVALRKTLTYDELLPEYMRLAEAEQRLKEGTLSDKIRTARV